VSLGVKTANGDVKIYSVHIKPTDGYYTTQQIVEALEANSDISSNANTPVATMYKTDETYSRYIRSFSSASLLLKGYSFNDKATKVNCGLYMTGGSFPIRKSDSGIFPVATDSFGDFHIRQGEKMKLKINSDKIGTRHPAIVKKYPTIFDNQWIDFENDEFNFTDLATLTDATIDDYIIVYKNGSTYYVYRYVGESAPIFEISSGSNYRAMNSQKDFRHDIASALVMSTGRKLNDVVTINSSEGTDAFPIANVIAATFDIKDANDMVLFAKNADITDYVLPTT
jgi:hypothetical protein